MEVEKSKKRLGRGLSSLLQNNSEPKDPVREKLIEKKTAKSEPTKSEKVTSPSPLKVAIEKIQPNPEQPRTEFDKAQLEQLASSIKEKGLIQPIVVQKLTDRKYKIVAGERRWRASQIAGLHEVPIVVREYLNDSDTLELALIENVQREDLNPIEEAKAYKNLQEKFGHTQNKIAEKIGKDRTTVANSMRLLALHETVQTMLVEKKITVGHAKALLSIEDTAKQLKIAKKIVSDKLNVRTTESLIQKKEKEPQIEINIADKLAKSLAEDMQKLLGRKVTIDYKNKKGKMTLHFYSDSELTELVDTFRRGHRKDADI